MQEEWAVLDEFPSYAVSTFGQVANIHRDSLLSLGHNTQGITMVKLMDEDHRQVTRSVALLVAQTFIEQRRELFNSPIHLDGDRRNCRWDNLMWRPRWFAVMFHRQFKEPRFYHPELKLGIKGTDETFHGWKDPCIKYGILYKSVIDSYHSGDSVFPTGHVFVRLGW